MPDSQAQTATAQPDALFDRYTLPKLALAVILAASLAGTWVTTTLSGGASPGLALAKWGYLVGLGVLTGGLVWKHVFVRPADLGDGTAGYCASMYDRFDRIAVGAIALVGIGGAMVLRQYAGVFGLDLPVLGFAGLLGSWLLLAILETARSGDVERAFRTPLGLATLALAVSVVVATAIAEVALRGLDPVAAGVRILHLLAFALWLGGAVWNIFVAVPTGQERPTLPVVRAAGEQLERFRWAVRFIIPTLFLTGLVQAIEVFGTSLTAYLGSTVGLAVLVKVGFIGLLVAIFKLCPMWRACSPIEGVCDLEDLGTDDDGAASAQATDETEATSGVSGDD